MQNQRVVADSVCQTLIIKEEGKQRGGGNID